MKFLCNFHTKLLFFFTSAYLLFQINPLFAQYHELGIPYVQEIDFKNFGYKNQNYSIIQDNKGVFYIGNDNGIIEFDGSFWNLIPFKGKPFLSILNDTIYAGGYNSFGFLAPGKKNKTTFYSLLSRNEPEFGQLTNIIAYDQKLFFCTNNTLFELKDSNLAIIDSSKSVLKLFKVKNSLILFCQENGLSKYVNGKFTLFENGIQFKGKNIIDILPYKEQLLIKLKNNNNFILLNSKNISAFYTEADIFLEKNEYTTGIELSDGSYYLGTQKGGIVNIDKNGKIINFITQQNNLTNNTILKFYVDIINNLWVLHPNGLSEINITSASTYFHNTSGYLGDVYSITRHNERLYLGTSQGVFYLSKNQNYSGITNKKFYSIKGINSTCLKFISLNEQLFVLTKEGIYSIKGEKAFLSFKLQTDNYSLSEKENTVFATHNNEIKILKFVSGKWENTYTYFFQGLIKEVINTDNNILWINTFYDGIYRIPIPELKKQTSNLEKFKITEGLPDKYNWSNIYLTSNGIFFTCSEGVWKFDNNKNKFIGDNLINITEYSGIYPIVEDDNKNLWISSFEEGGLYNKQIFGQFNGKDKPYKLKEFNINQPKNFNIVTIYPEKSGIIWFVGDKRIIRYNSNLKQKITSTFYTLIKNIKTGTDSIICYTTLGAEQEHISKIPCTSKKIHFELSATDYQSLNNLYYQYNLEGFDNCWSKWERSNKIEYTHLPKGNYTFKIRAKNIYGDVSEEAIFKFKILPQIYNTWTAFIIYAILGISLIALTFRLRINYLINEKQKLETLIRKRTKDIAIQKEKADSLLASVQPKGIIDEPKDTGKEGSKKYTLVTVLFSDIQGFTRVSEELNPEVLIDELDRFFLHFDSVVERYNIEKIKTIGDAYMCAGGIPKENRTNPIEVVLAAMEMQQYMKTIQKESAAEKNIWGLRIGIDTGPIVSGVVGRKKTSYDIWGSTVNTASRMESAGEVDKINITGNTFILINDFFICQYRGKMPIKNKGEIDMYFVESIRPKLSKDLKGFDPNDDLKIQLQLLRLSDLEELVLTKLEEGLPKNLYYHNLKHTVDVYTQVELIGKSENVSEEELLILRTAALFHDAGHTIDFDTHEEMGVKLATEILPGFKYTENQMNKISELILATKMPPNPKNLLEKIICDADLDYLGRIDFIPVSRNLFRELNERNKINSEKEWNLLQIKFIQSHQYFTKTARRLRDVNKNKQLENIRKLVNND